MSAHHNNVRVGIVAAVIVVQLLLSEIVGGRTHRENDERNKPEDTESQRPPVAIL